MKILAAILAGGRSTRFGTDKAQALHHGQPLVDHIIAALTPQSSTLVITGRNHPGHTSIADCPAPDLGPLGGLCAALHHAAANGFTHVLCAPCDTLDLPPDLTQRLAPGPAVALGQRTIGLWPATLAASLTTHLQGPDRSIRHWIAATNAREIDCGRMRNINHPTDLAK
nr:molybdenum cofactor guanylyltransferase [Polymorphobacter sp.]